MDRITLIVVPDETSPVRRFQVPRVWLRNAAVVAAALAVVLLLGVADWVRLRIDAVDVERMRAESELQRVKLETLGSSVTELEEALARIREFERKVRVIANLPTAMTETGGSELGGQGGELDGEGARSAGPQLPRGAAGGEGDDVSQLGEGLDAAALARTQSKARRLSGVAEAQGLSIEELVGRLEGKSERLEATPSIWPTQGWVTSGYGYRLSPFTGQRKFHAGIDIAADFGTEIIAPAKGKVVQVGSKGPMGKSVTLDHGWGTRTTYGHAAEIYVKLGQLVERGQRIAAVGSTGRSTGPHLHYGVSLAGRSVNPMNYILE